MSRIGRLIAPVLLCAVQYACGESPADPLITLKPANAEARSAFSLISSVRELSDLTVLVTDEKENRLVWLDFQSAGVRDIARTGDGPGEFRRVGRLWPLAADSSIVADLEAPRWLILDGRSIVNTLSGDASVIRTLRFASLYGVDRGRGVVTIYPPVTSEGRPLLRDSTRVLRADRVTGDTQTVARATPYAGSSQGPSDEAAADRAPVRTIYAVAILIRDQVTLSADGWLAIARPRPYRVDWCAPTQPCRSGQPIERALRMRDAHKRLHLEVASRTTHWPPTKSLEQTAGWPDFVPPFVYPHYLRDGSALLAMPGGSVLVERFLSSNATTRTYDIIDRSGHRTAMLAIPVNERIVGFGPRSVYVVVTDELDLQTLRRHSWP